MKRAALLLLQFLWAAAAAYIPVALTRFANLLRSDIGCPSAGDCYVPGSEHLLDLDLIILFAAVVLWPVSIWVGLVRPVLLLRSNERSGS
jgi:hypothetical protein